MKHASRIVLCLSALISAGCYVEEESAAPPPPPAPAPAADAAVSAPAAGSRSDAPRTGGRSTLGAAKRSAEGTVGSLEQRSKDLEKQIGE